MVKERIGNLVWLRKRVEEADTDLLREMLKAMAETLMSAEADSLCGADYGKRSPDRVNQRNGYRTLVLLPAGYDGPDNAGRGGLLPKCNDRCRQQRTGGKDGPLHGFLRPC